MNKLGTGTGFFLHSENCVVPPYSSWLIGRIVCIRVQIPCVRVRACGFLMNCGMLMVVKQWFLQLIGCNGWYSELLHNWWGCLVDVPVLLWIEVGRVCEWALCMWKRNVFCFFWGGWGPRLPEKVGSCYFRGSSCQFLLTEAHSAVSIMYDCVSRARMVSDSLIKLEENKGII